MFLASAGLLLIATGYGSLSLAPFVNPIGHSYQSLTQQPITDWINTSDASGLINLGWFIIILAAISYLAPWIIAAWHDSRQY